MIKIININGLPIGKLKLMMILMKKDGCILIILILSLAKMKILNMLEEENGLDMQIKYNLYKYKYFDLKKI